MKPYDESSVFEFFKDLLKEYLLETLNFKQKIYDFYKALEVQERLGLRDFLKIKTLAYYLNISSFEPFRIILKEIANKLLEFLRLDQEEIPTLKFCPQALKETWKKDELIPQGIENELVKGLSTLKKGDLKSLLKQFIKISLSYTWGIGYVISDIEDLLGAEENKFHENYRNRMSVENLMYALGGRFKASLIPLAENIKNGNILGVVFLDGIFSKREIGEITKELLKNDVLVIATDKKFFEDKIPEVEKSLGQKLREVLEVFTLPPVIYLGKSNYASDFLKFCREIINTGVLGESYSNLPVIVIPPKIFVGGFLFSGFKTLIEPSFLQEFKKILKKEYGDLEVSEFTEKERVISLIINHILEKRKKLGIEKHKRVLFDMEMRRKLGVDERVSFLHKIEYFKQFKENREILVKPVKIAYIDTEKCIRCLTCFKICPFLAVEVLNERNLVLINEKKCTGCELCIKDCPVESIKIKRI